MTTRTTPTPDAPVWLTLKQVARRETVHEATILRWVREGRFPKPAKLGANCTRWRVELVEKWEAERGEVA